MLRSIDQENLGSNPVLPCQTLHGQVRFSLSCMEEYMAIDSGGYLCTSGLHALGGWILPGAV